MTAHAEPSGLDHDQVASADGSRCPGVIVFDVNETLSDMTPMAQRFATVGAPSHLAATWFASLLRDGFALTAAGAKPSFAELAAGVLRNILTGLVVDVDSATEHIMSGFASLPLHQDVVGGILTLRELGIRLVTLSNGSTAVARGLFERNDLVDCFERVLSVEQAPRWKPAKSAYSFALDACECEAAEAMLVAVHPWDIHGAHQAGLATAWINRTDVRYPTYFASADIEATSLLDLAAQLGGVSV